MCRGGPCCTDPRPAHIETLWRRGELDEGEALVHRAALDGNQDALATMGWLCSERGESEEADRWFAMVDRDGDQ